MPDAEELARIAALVEAKHGPGWRYVHSVHDDHGLGKFLGDTRDTTVHVFTNGKEDWDERRTVTVLQRDNEIHVNSAM